MHPVDDDEQRRHSLGEIIERTVRARVNKQEQRKAAEEQGWSVIKMGQPGVRVTYVLAEPDNVDIFAQKSFHRNGTLLQLFKAVFRSGLMQRKLLQLEEEGSKASTLILAGISHVFHAISALCEEANQEKIYQATHYVAEHV